MLLNDLYEKKMTEWSEKNDSKLSVTEIDKLAKLRAYYHGYQGPYGVGYQLIKYMGDDSAKKLTCQIEHGAYINSKILFEIETENISKGLITFGNFRKETIERLSDKIALPIGPYIVYAEDYKTKKEYLEEKKRYGKTLLVMFTHNIPSQKFYFDIEWFIKKINEIATQFDTVMVSIHFCDVNSALRYRFQKEGYILVSAGNNSSPFFLNRMKYIFQLSDAVMANSYTSGLAYACGLNKPIYIVPQKLSRTKYEHKDNCYLEDDSEKVFNELCEICNKADFSNYNQQQKWAEYMFGTNLVKTQQELRTYLEEYIR